MRCPDLAELPQPPAGRSGWPWTEQSPHPPDTLPIGAAWPKLSIVTPSYKQGQFLEETIRSVLLQGYPEIEYIVVDGGSKDRSIEIIEKYAKWFTSWVSEKDRGQSDAINKGFAKCTARFGGWLNSDDVMLPGALAEVGRQLSAEPDVVMLIGLSEYRNSDGTIAWHRVERVPTNVEELCGYFEGRFVPQPSCFFDVGRFSELGGIDEKLHYAMDLDLWFRLMRTGRVKSIGSQLSWMRSHDDAKTNRDRLPVAAEVERVLMNYADEKQIGMIRRTAAAKRSLIHYLDAQRAAGDSDYLSTLRHLSHAAVESPARFAAMIGDTMRFHLRRLADK